MDGSDIDRTQPEFSLGERLARVESTLDARSSIEGGLQSQIDRRLSEAERLQDEKIKGVKGELGAINTAQKEAINKAEQATSRQAELMREQADRRSEVSDARLQALERGESAGAGEKTATAAIVAYVFAAITIAVSLAAVLATLLTH